MPRTEKETSNATLAPKKRGRPAGSKNKTKVTPVKRGRPVGSTNKPKEVAPAKKRGRPVGSSTKAKAVAQKPEVIPSAPVEDTPMGISIPQKPNRGRPVVSKNTSQPDVPSVSYTMEPIRGFMEIMKKWGDLGYMIYQISATSMELQAEDMPKAVQKYVNHWGKLPTRAILNEHNEKLIPYLNAAVPDIEIGLTKGGTALWEIQLQVPKQ